MGVAPVLLALRVQPYCIGPLLQQAAEPDAAGLRVPVLDRAAGMGDLVRAHRGVTDDDDLVVRPVFVEQVEGRDGLGKAAPIVLPDALVTAVGTVEIFELA